MDEKAFRFIKAFLFFVALKTTFTLGATLELKKISYYQGILIYKEFIENTSTAFDIEEIMKGINAAHAGNEILPESDDLEKMIKNFQEDLLTKVKEENLLAANRFLEDLATQPDTHEIVPNKLYYKILVKGNGPSVADNDSPVLRYAAKALEKGILEENFTSDDPKPILLKSTIKGFAKGVVGMQEGETRVLYIHPDLAYGTSSNKVAPNTLMFFEVTVTKKAE